MLSVNDLSMQFGTSVLFSKVDLQFTAGNCYGIIGANGAGKSTFVKILSGELEPTSGSVNIDPKCRMSVLKQNQNLYDDCRVIDTVIMGNERLWQCGIEKDAIYEKPDFSDEDGVRAAELEEEYAELGGWEAESDAARILKGLGVDVELHEMLMSEIDPRLKVKVLLAQALFGHPDIILLDEPTNNLDLNSVVWLENFLMDYEGTVLVVSHDRYFLNNICTHIVDIDYGKIKLYVGNYDFWYESSQLIQKLVKDQNKKAEQKIAELQTFIARFSANRSKSRQATSRRKLLSGVSFIVGKEDKIAIVGKNELAVTMLFKILMGEEEPDTGTVKWGASIENSYFPKDNSAFFDGSEYDLIDWMRQFSADKRESYLRTFLGRMLFSGDDVYKPVRVLSGGERVRCMISRMMLSGANFLVFDQPTNHLDLESIAALNNGMEAFKHNIIFACHDHQLTQTVANRIIEITDDGIIDKRCTYDEYMHIADETSDGNEK